MAGAMNDATVTAIQRHAKNDDWYKRVVRGVDSSLQDYEMQYFGFTTKSFVDGVFNAFMYYLCDILDVLQSILEKECPGCLPKGREKEPLQNMLPRIMEKLTDIFKKLEHYLNKFVFVVPPHILLPEDAVHGRRRYTARDEALLDKDIADLKSKITAAHHRNALLRQQLVLAKSSLTRCREVADELNAARAVAFSTAEGDVHVEPAASTSIDLEQTVTRRRQRKSSKGRTTASSTLSCDFTKKMAKRVSTAHRLMSERRTKFS